MFEKLVELRLKNEAIRQQLIEQERKVNFYFKIFATFLLASLSLGCLVSMVGLISPQWTLVLLSVITIVACAIFMISWRRAKGDELATEACTVTTSN